MAISSTTNRVAYTGNGATSVYSYGCRIFAKTDLLVTVRLISTGVETPLVLTTDYTVGGVGNSTGNITLVDASQAWLSGGNLKSTYKLIIRRVRPLKQSTSIRNESNYYAATHEDVFDHLVMLAQQIQDNIDRSARLPETFTNADFSPYLPAGIIGVPNTSIVTDGSTGTSLVAGPTTTQIAAAQGYAASASASQSAASASQSSASASAAAAAASAVAAAISAGTIGSELSATLANNQVAAADVTGLLINSTTYKSAIVQYLIQRITTGGGATELVESGQLILTYLPTSATWRCTQIPSDEDSGITFTITSAGQVQYVSTNISGTASISKVNFKTQALTGA